MAVIVIAVILIGEVAAYHPAVNYSSDAKSDGSWSVGSSGTFEYDTLLLDSGNMKAPTKIIIYRDSSYGSHVNDGLVEVGARNLDQDYYISQLRNNLSYLGVTDVTVMNAQALKDALSSDAYKTCGVVCLTGALPDTVYNGVADSLILKWIQNGGTLYWAGQQVGRFIGHSDKTVTEVTGDYAQLFIGVSGCLNTAEQNEQKRAGTAYSDVTENNFRYALSMKNNNILYAVNDSMLSSVPHLSAGYREGGYVSTCIVKNGNGQVCVMGGDFSNHQRMDLASIIAAGLCCSSTLESWSTGTVCNNTVTGRFDVPTAGNCNIFIVLGGDFAVYGRNYTI